TTSGLSYSCGVAALFTGVKAETTETRFPDLERPQDDTTWGRFFSDCAAQSDDNLDFESGKRERPLSGPPCRVFDGFGGVTHHAHTHLAQLWEFGHVILLDPLSVVRLDLHCLL